MAEPHAEPDFALEPHEQLAQYINAANFTEVDCQPFLRYAARRLVPTPMAIAAMAGRSDYFIVCTETNARGNEVVKIWLWECKAPQHYQFFVDNRNRLCPTKELTYAENQLIHYHRELSTSPDFRDRWRVAEADIMLGGIIIGRQDRLVQPNPRYDIPEIELGGMYDVACQVRDRYVYRGQIKLYTWDQIQREVPRPDTPMTQATTNSPLPNEPLEGIRVS
jgi:hypothetical protein